MADFTRKVKSFLGIKSPTQRRLELMTEMNLLSDDLQISIDRDMDIITKSEREGVQNVRAEKRVKDAYYTLLLLDQAKQLMEDNRSEERLNKVINRTAVIMGKVNAKAEFAPQLKTRFMDWQADALNEKMVKHPEPIQTGTAEKIHLPDTIIQRLKGGSSIDKCIKSDRLIIETHGIENAPYELDFTDNYGHTASYDIPDNVDIEEQYRRIKEMQQQNR